MSYPNSNLRRSVACDEGVDGTLGDDRAAPERVWEPRRHGGLVRQDGGLVHQDDAVVALSGPCTYNLCAGVDYQHTQPAATAVETGSWNRAGELDQVHRADRCVRLGRGRPASLRRLGIARLRGSRATAHRLPASATSRSGPDHRRP